MSIGGFGSLFELFAAINIAFVVVEYAKNYTNILARKVFNLQKVIEDEFGKLSSIFSSEDISLNTIKNLNINGYDASQKIEACKRDKEKLEEEVNTEKQNLSDSIDEKCNFRNFSNQCLWSFLFCIVALFLAGLETTESSTIPVSVLGLLTSITLIYYTIGWIFGEKDCNIINNYFNHLIYTIIGFVILATISVIVSIYSTQLNHIVLIYKDLIIPIAALIPFLNFIIYFIVSINRIKSLKKDIRNSSSNLNEKCIEWKDTASQIINAHNLGDSLQVTKQN